MPSAEPWDTAALWCIWWCCRLWRLRRCQPARSSIGVHMDFIVNKWEDLLWLRRRIVIHQARTILTSPWLLVSCFSWWSARYLPAWTRAYFTELTLWRPMHLPPNQSLPQSRDLPLHLWDSLSWASSKYHQETYSKWVQISWAISCWQHHTCKYS